ncbi:MAG: hypothetical protein JKY70_08585 [Mucilaginibacter sp.]|nr:hypothetical protein [Mucilaginibacter sp.]
MELLLLLIAPVWQIIASVARIKDIISMRLIYIALVALAIGFAMTFVLTGMVANELAQENYHCGMPMIGALLAGLFITFITVPIIGGLSYWIFGARQKRLYVN